MARINKYNNSSPVVGGDKLVGTDSSGDTKNFVLNDVKTFINKDNVDVFGSDVGLKFSWSTIDSSYRVQSSHAPGLVYSKLGVDFENLVLEPGYIYKLIIERKRGSTLRDGATASVRKGGYKRQSTTESLPSPYTSRLSEIPIVSTTGQLFDYKWDLFFRGGSDFPKPSGFGKKLSGTSNIDFAFRISRTKQNVTEESIIISKIKLRGLLMQNEAGQDVRRVTFLKQ